MGFAFQGWRTGGYCPGDLGGRRVPLALVGVDSGWALGVEEATGTGCRVDEGFDGGILAVGVVGGIGHGGEDGWRDDFCILQASGRVELEV